MEVTNRGGLGQIHEVWAGGLAFAEYDFEIQPRYGWSGGCRGWSRMYERSG